MSEKPVHSRRRTLVDGINLTGAKKVHSLIDKVYKRKNLEMAWEKVKPNRGSGGVDGQSLRLSKCTWSTHRRYRYKDRIDEVERAKNRTKSTVRSKVEHVFAVMKLKFGFVKLRYRGLKKNATQLFAVYALVNLYLARKKLLLLEPA